MDKTLLVEGGPTYARKVMGALEHAGIALSEYRADRDAVRRRLVGQRHIIPLDVQRPSNYGDRWRSLFDWLDRIEEYQMLDVGKQDFFITVRPDNNLLKTSYLLTTPRWNPQQDKLSVREALQTGLDGYFLEDVLGLSEIYMGLDFGGVGPNTHFKVTSPYNWLRGDALDIESMKIALQFGSRKGDPDINARALEQGIRIVARDVPSLRGDKTLHEVTITNVPVYRVGEGVSDRTKRIGYGIITSDDCGRATFADDDFARRIKLRFGKDERYRSENDLDHHTFAILKAAGIQVSRERPELAMDGIFPEFNPRVEDYVEAAYRGQIVVTIPGSQEKKMLWESVTMMHEFVMMAYAHVNSQQRLEQLAQTAPTAA